MQFNKLYNLILESIINQNKESRAKILATRQDHQAIQYFLNQLAQKSSLYNKIADFLAKLFAKEELIRINDQRIKQIITVFKRQPNIDIQKDWDLTQFLSTYKTLIKREQNKSISQKLIDIIDSGQYGDDTFTDKFVENEVTPTLVIYKVADTKKAQKAVRQIVDIEWGKDANPWCLIKRDQNWNEYEDDDGMDQAWYYWKQYNAYPKHIAFQGGHLLAFCANDEEFVTWWDRNDNATEDVVVLMDGSEYGTQNYAQLSPEQKKARKDKIIEEFKNQYHLKYDQKLDCYNSIIQSVVIKDDYLIDGHLPVKFGEVNGNFTFYKCRTLTSIQGSPKKVNGQFVIEGCWELSSIAGSPEYISKDYIISECNKITSIQGMTQNIKNNIILFHCAWIKNLNGAPKNNKIWIQNCTSLQITEEDKKTFKEIQIK